MAALLMPGGPTWAPSSSFSAPSLAEESEPISEVEELKAVRNRVVLGGRALRAGQCDEAQHYFDEALEIDETCMEALYGRAMVFVKARKFILAQHDADKVIILNRNNFKGHYVQALALGGLGYHRESLVAHVKAMHLDQNSTHTEELTNHIAEMAHLYCPMPEELVERFPSMDAYKKLSEVGACLFNGKKYDLSIKVLMAAQRLATNQQGIHMKVQLTLANAHAALKNNDQAISCYQECLLTAVASHDYHYQTKSLVSIASLFLEIGDTHQAIVYYEKLLCLRRELQNEEDKTALPEYWSHNLECALQLNLSIAYKSIGNYDTAINHAAKYLSLVKGAEGMSESEGQAHHNLGILYEVIGKYQEALGHFKNYQVLSRNHGNKRAVAVSYGCLGSIYGHLKNSHLSNTYHEQHVKLAENLNDAKMLVMAHEQSGDTLMVLKLCDDAAVAYTAMYRACSRNDIQGQATALYKLGRTYEVQGRYQYAAYYTSEARILAEDNKLHNMVTMCEFELAAIYQQSTQMMELEEAKKLFRKLMPMFEAKLAQHYEEDSFCPQELRVQIQRCYAGMQNVLIKLGSNKESLLFADAYKSKHQSGIGVGVSPVGSMARNVANWKHNTVDLWNMERVERVLSEQTATVLYYSFIPSALLLWVLQPGAGITRFYSRKSSDPDCTVSHQVEQLIDEIQSTCQNEHLCYESEHRALPPEGADLRRLQRKNEQLGQREGREEYVKELEEEVRKMDENVKDQSKPPERKLFDILIAPVSDILCKLEDDAPLIIVPDGVLNLCPFGVLKDWSKVKLCQKYRLSVLPSLTSLEQVCRNESVLLQGLDELDFQRTQQCKGGVSKVKTEAEFAKSPKSMMRSRGKHLDEPQPINLRQTSNPRLATSNKPGLLTSTDKSLLHEATSNSLKSQKLEPGLTSTSLQVAPYQVPTRLPAVGIPLSLDKMIGKDGMSTLTSVTATNVDIVKSDVTIPQFKQMSCQLSCVVIGSPSMPDSVQLRGESWKPPSQMEAAQRECHRIADILEVGAIVGNEATKARFLAELHSASVLHIATLGSLQEGALVFKPDIPTSQEGLVCEDNYLVRCQEIVSTGTQAKMIVLSGGWNSYDASSNSHNRTILHSAFLQAGAQCVVSLLWPVPNKTLNKFYFHFYKHLLSGSYVTHAVSTATAALATDERFADVSYQAPFYITGKDTFIDLAQIRHAFLDQSVDKAEAEVISETHKDPLNPPEHTPNVENRESMLESLQRCLSQLVASHAASPDVIPLLLDLLDAAIKRLHSQLKKQSTSHLPQDIGDSEAGMTLLKLLTFHFQANGAYISDPYVVYPHWNPDDLLVPACEAIKALSDLVRNKECREAVEKMLPLSQELVSALVDVLCLTRHAGEVQLKVTDLTVKPLWQKKEVRNLLTSLGFHQIGVLLAFDSVPTNRKLLMAMLQMMVSCSIHKSSILLHKLDVSLLGGPRSDKVATAATDFRLPSLTPLLLPRNQLRMSTPWLSHLEHPDEMEEKMKLAHMKSDVSSDYQHQMFRAKTWHEATVITQADNSLDKLLRPKSSPKKVKVIRGPSTSCPTVPVDQEPSLTIPAADQRRDYAHYILSQRLDKVAHRHRNDVRKLFLPYLNA